MFKTEDGTGSWIMTKFTICILRQYGDPFKDDEVDRMCSTHVMGNALEVVIIKLEGKKPFRSPRRS
jgi:hypothetical protein